MYALVHKIDEEVMGFRPPCKDPQVPGTSWNAPSEETANEEPYFSRNTKFRTASLVPIRSFSGASSQYSMFKPVFVWVSFVTMLLTICH